MWDLTPATGPAELATLPRQDLPVHAAALSPDGKAAYRAGGRWVDGKRAVGFVAAYRVR